jgi:integrase
VCYVGKPDAATSCPSGLERAGRKRTPLRMQRAALPLYVGRLLDSGVDIAIVAKMAGHANIQTTVRYDCRPEEAKQRAAKLLQIPYVAHVSKLKSVKETQFVYRPFYC